MLVYGEQHYPERLSVLLQRLRQRRANTRPGCLEGLRTLVIQAGQLEQGVADRWPGHNGSAPQLVGQIARLTDLAARAFCGAWARASGMAAARAAQSERALATLAQTLESIHLPEDPVLSLRIPEGFEFYALFPEQYCTTAWKWAQQHAGAWPKGALVVGVRSIGTALSALVAAALEAVGWEVERLTVRPTGHPFARRVDWIPSEGPDPRARLRSDCALVVDEGPGLSGSSMAAVGQALVRAGYSDISFLPGHGGEPGSAASAAVRRWWAQTPRYWTPLEDLRWGGLSLAQSLAVRAQELCDGMSGRKLAARTPTLHCRPRFEDLSAGLWRARAFTREADWPAVGGTFERTKYHCTTRTGRAVLWKFAGFGCARPGQASAVELALEQMEARAETGLVPPPLGSFHGFIAQPWIEGERLRQPEALEAPVLAHLGQYLVCATGPALAETEAKASFVRLREMLYANTREVLGEKLAERSGLWAEAAAALEPTPAYGDGRLAPHEWVRTPVGRLVKTDCTGHDLDHTLVGKQSVLWDAAGALVEWDLEPGAAGRLLAPLRAAGITVEREALGFYRMAYAAFHLGLTSLCASQLPAGDAEHKRLERASARYRSTLERLLRAEPVGWA